MITGRTTGQLQVGRRVRQSGQVAAAFPARRDLCFTSSLALNVESWACDMHADCWARLTLQPLSELTLTAVLLSRCITHLVQPVVVSAAGARGLELDRVDIDQVHNTAVTLHTACALRHVVKMLVSVG